MPLGHRLSTLRAGTSRSHQEFAAAFQASVVNGKQKQRINDFIGFLSEQGGGRWGVKIYLQRMQFLTTELLNVVVTENKTSA